jgi:hypothetical protein
MDVWDILERLDDEDLCVPELLEEFNYEVG